MFGTVFSAPLIQIFKEHRCSCVLFVFCLVKTGVVVFSAPLIKSFKEHRCSCVPFLWLFGDLLHGANLGLNVHVVAAASFLLLHQVIVHLLILNRWNVEVHRCTWMVAYV